MTQDRSHFNDTALVWFRDDLRIRDNAALTAASKHKTVLAIYIRETNSPGRPIGAARKWWLHHSLEQLATKLKDLGTPLILLSGDPVKLIPDLAKSAQISAVYWNRRYDPAFQERDASVKSSLQARQIMAKSFSGQLAHEPTRLRTGGGSHYRVYSPFWRAIEQDVDRHTPLPAPDSLNGPADLDLTSENLDDWALRPTRPDWATGLRQSWTPGEDAAHKRLKDFVENRMQGYSSRRDIPSVEATSGLSPHLAAGELTPAQIFAALTHYDSEAGSDDHSKYRKEIGWREFSWHLLVNEPQLAQANHNPKFDAFPWNENLVALKAWQKGLTGYPIVDAGMRELWQTGWMHNRVRMITASFLTKHLMIDWREGERWFWDTLVDADPASNAASWQWVAGSGADAAPYFRIFNPIIQGEKFDPDGDYVRRFVPELSELPAKYIHKPWAAPKHVLTEAGVQLGKTYPDPIVDHQAARDRALAAYQKIKDAA